MGDRAQGGLTGMVGREAWTAAGPIGAPAIVFVHGTLLTRRQWDAPMRLLAARYRCVAVDLPGHGRLADVPFTRDAAADVVADAIAAESADGRAVVVGLSLGGYVAIDAAARHPERVAGLVLAGCSAEPDGLAALLFRALARLLDGVPPSLLARADGWLFRFRYRERVARPVIEGGFWPAGGAAALRAIVGGRYLDRLAWLWTPVLLVNGALDPVFGPAGAAWASACRSGRHLVIPRATHLAPLDRPRAFAGIVARFAAGIAREA